MDYLALLRDSHDRLISMRGLTRIKNLNLQQFEAQISRESGSTVIFPDWLPLVPTVEIIGARIAKIGEDQSVSLLFTLDEHNVNYVTIFNSRQEINDLETIKMEDHDFRVYKWGIFQGYFWEITEDNTPITYGLISDLNDEELKMMATDTMRSLKNHYLPKE